MDKKAKEVVCAEGCNIVSNKKCGVIGNVFMKLSITATILFICSVLISPVLITTAIRLEAIGVTAMVQISNIWISITSVIFIIACTLITPGLTCFVISSNKKNRLEVTFLISIVLFVMCSVLTFSIGK